MKNELKKHKKQDTIKWVAISLIVILLVVAVCALLAEVFNAACWFSHKYDENGVCVRCGAEKPIEEQDEQNTDADGGMLVQGGIGNGIMLLSMPIARTEYSDYNINPIAESAQQLTAIIEPANAVNKLVDWHIFWKNDNSEWAKNKAVTDYVTVTPVSDGATTANVACLQAFGEQIIIDVTSRENPSIRAQKPCTVDYVQKIIGFTFNMPDIDSTTTSFTYNVETSIYTIKSDISLETSTKIALTTNFINNCKASATTQGHAMCFLSPDLSISGNQLVMSFALDLDEKYSPPYKVTEAVFEDDECPAFVNYFVGIHQRYSFNPTQGKLYCFRRAVNVTADAHATFDLIYKATYNGVDYSFGTQTIECRFDGQVLHVPVTGLSLSNSGIFY